MGYLRRDRDAQKAEYTARVLAASNTISDLQKVCSINIVRVSTLSEVCSHAVVMSRQGSTNLAAISPYFNVFRQPQTPTTLKVSAAIYLFRHGIIEVSGHDFHTYLSPFLRRLRQLQQDPELSFIGPLSFLGRYRSWITEAHVGMINGHGLRQSGDLGHAFRQRYRHLISRHSKTRMIVSTDSAARCRFSAVEFARSLSGRSATPALSTPPVLDTSVLSIDPAEHPDPRTNLSWHTTYRDVDQTAGQEWMDRNMEESTRAARDRLQSFWPVTLTPSDVYSMQLLHCYDICSGRVSPWMAPQELFTSDDWEGFEYLRDGKYYFSEGPGAVPPTGPLALPWLLSALDFLQRQADDSMRRDASAIAVEFPLRVHFTHREEILYLCTLLGIGCYSDERDPNSNHVITRPWTPEKWATDRNTDRPWHVSLMACYLGHIGVEMLGNESGENSGNTSAANAGAADARIRFILNGDVVQILRTPRYDEVDNETCNSGGLQADADGAYSLTDIEHALQQTRKAWEEMPPTGSPDQVCWWSIGDHQLL